MGFIQRGALLGVALLAVAGCSGADPDGAATAISAPTAEAAVPTSEMPTSEMPTTEIPSAATAVTSTAPTTTVAETESGRDESCVVTVLAGDSLSKIADLVDGVTVDQITAENWLGENHVIQPDDELDVCIGNDVDDVRGSSRLAPEPATVRRQQQRLNELFAPYLIADLVVDGDSGSLTRQLLCAARMGLGLPVNAGHMAAGSAEEDALFEAESLSIPDGAATWANHWVLIDESCQVMFTGNRDDGIANVFPTSTGQRGFETRNVGGIAAFRFDPALDNGGWHDSSRFPVAGDNPQNGNMYKPIYFSSGQAIHGANHVPPEPRSKGCARMFTWHQDALIDWLGLDDVVEPTWQESRIGLTVTVQGSYRPLD